ncbi:hypothetical protein TNCV_951501, partial [Trichonephila clavipes]
MATGSHTMTSDCMSRSQSRGPRGPLHIVTSDFHRASMIAG